MTLEQLFESGNWVTGYVKFGTLSSYHRLGMRSIGGTVYKTVCRANTTNTKRRANVDFNPRIKSLGQYRALDERAAELGRQYSFEALMVEAVLNHFLPDVLLRYGYTELATEGMAGRNFYRLL